MRWAFLAAGVGAVVMWYGVGPQYALLAVFAVLCINFATFCLQYEAPMNRARQRVAAQLRNYSPGGLHADEYQRLQSAQIKVSAEDRKVQYGVMTCLNLASGLAAMALVVWGLVLRMG